MTEFVHNSPSGKTPASHQTAEDAPYGGDSKPVMSSNFENKSARIGFIQKVLAILSVQVILEFFLITMSSVNWYFNYWTHANHIVLMLLSWSAYLATLVLPFFYTDTRQKPYSMILLVACPLSLASGVMVFTNVYLDAEIELLFAWGFYGLVMVALLVYSVFALHTTLEFQATKGLFITACLLVYLYSIACLTVSCAFTSNRRLLYLTLLVFLECASKLYFLHELTSGEYHLPITPGDYVWGALHTHIDVGYTCVEYARKLKARLYKT